MTDRAQKETVALIVLIAVLATAIYFMIFRGESAPAATPPAVAGAAPVKTAAVASDARIRLDLIRSDKESREVGRKNLFQYRIPPPPPKPVVATTTPQVFTPLPATQTPVRPVTPPLPAITLRYTGFATTSGPSAKKYTAELFDGDKRYNAEVGQYVLGKYRVVSITETVVDIEDIEYNRRQSLQLVKNP